MDKKERINWLKARIEVHKSNQQFSGLLKHYQKELKHLEDSMPKPMMHKVIEAYGKHCYLCNQACVANPKKFTYSNEKVNCKNCLKLLKFHPGGKDQEKIGIDLAKGKDMGYEKLAGDGK